MNILINEMLKMHNQITLPAAILMGLRARIESRQNVKNRIGKVFQDGNRGVLIIGNAGTGKTTVMRKIFDGLQLDRYNSQGKQVGKWFASYGSSTAVGVYETLELYADSVIFLDEFNLDNKENLHIIKQICNGEIARIKHHSIDPVQFNGMIVSAVNSIKIPSPNALEHLLATLDRFIVVKAEAPTEDPSHYIEKILTEDKPKAINWAVIRKALSNKNFSDLNNDEKRLLASMWEKFSSKVLDLSRAQWRNAHTAHDIFLFVKRMFNSKNLCEDPEAIGLIRKMMKDCIVWNPVSLLWLNPTEEIVYKEIENKEECSLQQIITKMELAGVSISLRHVHNVLNKLINSRVIIRTRHGKYSVCRVPPIKKPRVEEEIESLAKSL